MQTLQAVPDSMLGAMFSGRHSIRKLKDGSAFIDRDGTYFRIILNYLRGNILSRADLPDDAHTLSDLFKEVNYYQLTALQNIIKPKKTAVCQGDIDVLIKSHLGSGSHKSTKQNITFSNCILDNLRFNNVTFYHSLDLYDCTLENTMFSNCTFNASCQHSFDLSNLNGCKFEQCRTTSYNVTFADMIRDKKMTFYDAKNLRLAIFQDLCARQAIKETFNL